MIKSRLEEEETYTGDVLVRGIKAQNWDFLKKRAKETGYKLGEFINALIEQEIEEIERHEKSRKRVRKTVRKKTKGIAS